MRRVRGASGDVRARGPGFPPDLSPRAPPSPPVSAAVSEVGVEGRGVDAGAGRGAERQDTMAWKFRGVSKVKGSSKTKGSKSKPWKAQIQVMEDGKYRRHHWLLCRTLSPGGLGGLWGLSWRGGGPGAGLRQQRSRGFRPFGLPVTAPGGTTKVSSFFRSAPSSDRRAPSAAGAAWIRRARGGFRGSRICRESSGPDSLPSSPVVRGEGKGER